VLRSQSLDDRRDRKCEDESLEGPLPDSVEYWVHEVQGIAA
jgi:hypothetical protein